MLHPGLTVRMRLGAAGRDSHPFHFHGNNATLVARDARPLDRDPATPGLELAESNFTYSVPPGGTADAIYEWTGAKLGWDIYGHRRASDPLHPNEYVPDHGKPFPVTLPDVKDLTLGGMYSGSPFLGKTGPLLPGQTAESGYFFMWHSHNERELTTDNVFPGGLMTMLIVEAPWVPLP
jgi:FtsP/CotA-like multicopper oxidase with cupredoxin domain